ncbi:MAG: response regulator transcription factor [Eubacterium sp.]|nr:response regulator transcription factor [Eubacterium sp.]
MRKVLIVEDDREIRKLLKDYLTDYEYEVTEAKEGNEASRLIASECYDVILMDMMLPYRSGDILIRELRSRADDLKAARTPVIVISAKSGSETRIETIRIGADDYIIKPFDLGEVLVRIEAVLRRSADGEYTGTSGSADSDSGRVIRYGEIEYSEVDNTVTYKETPIKLTAKEMQLLAIMLKNPKKTFTKANLYESVWNDTYIYEDNTINVHMSNLRSKLKKATGLEYIETVWGIGYKLKQDVE